MQDATLKPTTVVFETTDHDVSFVPAARHALEAWLGELGIASATRDAAVLVADELFTNAIRNTFGLVRLTIDEAHGVVRLAVFDESLRLPNPLLALPGDERPHGLAVVDAIAVRWGAQHETFDGHVGKAVWATIPAA